MKIRILAVLLSLACFSSLAYSAELGLGRMGIVQGDVQIYSEDAGDWVPAAVNTPLTQGDRVWVPEGGRSELQFLGGLLIRLDDFTSLDFITLEENTYQFAVNSGRVYVNNRASGIDQLQIDTPVSSVTCGETSTIMIDVEENGATEISVLAGYAFAESENGSIRVSPGNTLRIGEDVRTTMYSLNSPDEWEEWNRDLDSRISSYGASNRYLPAELDSYSSDFDTNGTWFYDGSYGYVWTPTISASINWAPYHDGRWVWIGGNYVWISSERWGWAPYHYGRWIFLGQRGWCWVPPRQGAVYWGPGYVGWVYTSNYVSWVPLAPGEIYYGHGNYGPASVNINIVSNNNFSTHRNYINRNARNAIKIMHRDTFLHGRRVAVPSSENPFKQRNVGIGPPRFKPDRETYSPRLGNIPITKRPPERIRSTTPDTLRQEKYRNSGKRGAIITPISPNRTLSPAPREVPKRNLRQQKPDIYNDGMQKRETVQPKKSNQLWRELPVGASKPPTIVKPITPKRKADEVTPDRSRQQRQPATIRVAPQPVAPQPIAPTPAWTPSKPRLQENRRVPASQTPIRTPNQTLRKTIPPAPQVPAAAVQPRQLPKPPATFRQGAQTTQQQKPAAVEPITNQLPPSQENVPKTNPRYRQQNGQKGGQPTLPKGERTWQTR